MTTYDFKEQELQGLKGKTIIITGASTGIGRDTAKIAYSALSLHFSSAHHVTDSSP
jgi:BRCT domain type II-containing protein